MSETEESGMRCPFCNCKLYKRHCKYICEQHGPILDCSDPFRL